MKSATATMRIPPFPLLLPRKGEQRPPKPKKRQKQTATTKHADDEGDAATMTSQR